MSIKRAASPMHAVHVADDLPALALYLQAALSGAPAGVWGAGPACADAMQACVPALCLSCQHPIASCLENRVLDEFIQETLDGCASACPPPGSPRSKMPKASQAEGDAGTGLRPLLDRFAVASATLSQTAQAVAQAKDGVPPNALLCVDVFNHAVDGLLVKGGGVPQGLAATSAAAEPGAR